MFLKTILLFLSLLFVTSVICSRINRERFINEQYDKFFVLWVSSQSNESNDIITMNSIGESTVIGYRTNEEKYLFERLYRIHNDKLIKFDYKKLTEQDIDQQIDILLYTNDSIYLSNYVIIDYYLNNIQNQFQNYEFVVYNDNNNSTLVLQRKPNQSKIIELEQKVLLSNDYNFVIENNINGRYVEKDLNTNEITLFQNKLLNLEVKIDDLILLRKQKYPYMNGVYKVYKVDRHVYMLREDIVVLNKHDVCIDEDMVEHPEYTNKMSCEHENDLFGEKKNKIMTWDSRCRRNMECPFYDEEYKYPCVDGYCEMPGGVKQISFTKYM